MTTGTKRLVAALKMNDLVVLPQTKTKGNAIIKLKECHYNTLGWPVWSFSVVVGVVGKKVFAVAPFEMVEVLLPLIEMPRQKTPTILGNVFEVFVQTDSSVEGVFRSYMFKREELANKVLKAAQRFGLGSFIVNRFIEAA